jgi:hypothetical protein
MKPQVRRRRAESDDYDLAGLASSMARPGVPGCRGVVPAALRSARRDVCGTWIVAVVEPRSGQRAAEAKANHNSAPLASSRSPGTQGIHNLVSSRR